MNPPRRVLHPTSGRYWKVIMSVRLIQRCTLRFSAEVLPRLETSSYSML
jgi:hypothetical protein